MLKKFILLFIIQIFTVAISLANSNIVIGNIPLDHNKNVSFIPQNTVDSQALVKSKIPTEILISRDQYLLSYNHKTRLLNWVEWKLDITDLGDITRSNSFAVDQDLEEYLSKNNEHAVTMEDYKGSCFDRGHQVPSADRTRSLEDNQETFLLSNMIPQTAYMNRILWKNLEKYTRDLVLTQGKKVYIIAGPIFDENFGKIGVNKDIPIPSKDFKVIIILDHNQNIKDINEKTEIISVVMPNRLKSGKKPLEDLNELCTSKIADTAKLPISNDWKQYQTTIPEIEKMVGLKIIPTQLLKKARTKKI